MTYGRNAGRFARVSIVSSSDTVINDRPRVFSLLHEMSGRAKDGVVSPFELRVGKLGDAIGLLLLQLCHLADRLLSSARQLYAKDK